MRPTLERYKNFEDVLVGFQNQQFMAGKKALAPLPADAPEPAKVERKALLDGINGVPPSPKDYGIKKPDDMPDHMWIQSMADGAANWAHKYSVAPAALKELLDLNYGTVKSQMALQQQNETAFWNAQQQEFDGIIKSENIPSDRAQALVEKGAIAMGLDMQNEQTKILLKGSTARLMAMRHAIAIGEDKTVQAGGSSPEAGDPGVLAKDIQGNPANPLNAAYWNKDNKFSGAAHQQAVARVNELFRLSAAKRQQADKARRR